MEIQQDVPGKTRSGLQGLELGGILAIKHCKYSTFRNVIQGLGFGQILWLNVESNKCLF
jgi:hypothetical protein